MKSWKYLVPSGFWGLLILVLSLIPPPSLSAFSWGDLWNPDKLAHAGFYMVLSYLIMWGLYRLEFLQLRQPQIILAGVFISSAYGVLMEFLQVLISTGRYFELLDIIANIIGSFMAILIFKLKP